MKRTKQIFYKSVRADGSSVWAPPGLGRVYRIGHSYRFPKWAPAWVCPGPLAWVDRPEPKGSSRLLICQRHMEKMCLPFVAVSQFYCCFHPIRVLDYGSTYFKVIGEIKAPAMYKKVHKEVPKHCTKHFNPKRLLTPSV